MDPDYDPKDGMGAVVWAMVSMAMLLATAVAVIVTSGCRTAGTADQAARLNLRDVRVDGNLTLNVGSGDRTLETTQSAGKEVGLTAATAQAQAQDAAVGLGGSTVSKDAGGGNRSAAEANPK